MTESDSPNKSDLTETIRLLRLAKAGDQRAIENLYARYGERLRTIVRFRLGPRLRSKMESCDVVQETLMASVRHFDNAVFESDGAFLHWLTKLAENRIRDLADHFSAKKRDVGRERPLETPGLSTDSAFGPIPELATHSTPSKAAVLTEDLKRLEDEVTGLPDDQREALLLVRYTGLTYAEAGRELGRTPDAVRMLDARARVSLAKAFEKPTP